MRENFIKVILLFALLLPFLNIHSQNVVIDYAAWNPSSPPCNLFASTINVPATINSSPGSIVHETQAGQLLYNSSAFFFYSTSCNTVNVFIWPNSGICSA